MSACGLGIIFNEWSSKRGFLFFSYGCPAFVYILNIVAILEKKCVRKKSIPF